jgi:hypothetical protein
MSKNADSNGKLRLGREQKAADLVVAAEIGRLQVAKMFRKQMKQNGAGGKGAVEKTILDIREIFGTKFIFPSKSHPGWTPVL